MYRIHSVMNTLPLNNPWESKKVITLIIQDGIYQPVVNIPSEEKTIKTQHPHVKKLLNQKVLSQLVKPGRKLKLGGEGKRS